MTVGPGVPDIDSVSKRLSQKFASRNGKLTTALSDNIYVRAVDVPLAVARPVLDGKGQFKAEEV